MSKMTRTEMIDWLIENDTMYINEGNGAEWLASILMNGFEGYDNLPNDELRREILERDQNAFDV